MVGHDGPACRAGRSTNAARRAVEPYLQCQSFLTGSREDPTSRKVNSETLHYYSPDLTNPIGNILTQIRSLWPHWSTIWTTDNRTVPGIFWKRVLGSERFIHIDSEARILINDHVAILEGRAAREDFLRLWPEVGLLLNPEIPDGKVDVSIPYMTYGRRIPGTVPGRPHIEPLR